MSPSELSYIIQQFNDTQDGTAYIPKPPKLSQAFLEDYMEGIQLDLVQNFELDFTVSLYSTDLIRIDCQKW